MLFNTWIESIPIYTFIDNVRATVGCTCSAVINQLIMNHVIVFNYPRSLFLDYLLSILFLGIDANNKDEV